jgi:hypothetical protein
MVRGNQIQTTAYLVSSCAAFKILYEYCTAPGQLPRFPTPLGMQDASSLIRQSSAGGDKG